MKLKHYLWCKHLVVTSVVKHQSFLYGYISSGLVSKTCYFVCSSLGDMDNQIKKCKTGL